MDIRRHDYGMDNRAFIQLFPLLIIVLVIFLIFFGKLIALYATLLLFGFTLGYGIELAFLRGSFYGIIISILNILLFIFLMTEAVKIFNISVINTFVDQYLWYIRFFGGGYIIGTIIGKFL